MKNIKKSLVVLLASLFVSSVFAADATTADANATVTAPAAHVKKHHVKHCWKNKHGKKVCKHKRKKVVAKKVQTSMQTTSQASQTK